MHTIVSLYRPLKLTAFTLPPHDDDRGDPTPPSVTVNLTGDPAANEPSIALSFSIDEAKELADRLTQLVSDAQEGKYSQAGRELLDYHDEKAAARYAKINAEKDRS